jgi:hypothetical protein
MFNPLQYLPSPHDANQEPGHRWLRCLYLLEHRRSPTPEDDILTHTAYAFVRDWRRCCNDAQREQLAHAQPDLAEAHRFSQTASLRTRAEVEARLLARQSDESIAGLCALTPAAVRLYHELFIDVRPYLQAEFYIFAKAIGPKVHSGLTADDHDLLLKMAGYALGAVAVDQLLAYWADPPVWPVPLAQLDGPALETLQSKLWIQAWILSLTIPVNAATVARLPAIRQLVAQAGVLGKAADNKNSPLPAVQEALDCRALQSEPEELALHAARPSRAEALSSVHEPVRSVNPWPGDWQAVPA